MRKREDNYPKFMNAARREKVTEHWWCWLTWIYSTDWNGYCSKQKVFKRTPVGLFQHSLFLYISFNYPELLQLYFTSPILSAFLRLYSNRLCQVSLKFHLNKCWTILLLIFIIFIFKNFEGIKTLDFALIRILVEPSWPRLIFFES